MPRPLERRGSGASGSALQAPSGATLGRLRRSVAACVAGRRVQRSRRSLRASARRSAAAGSRLECGDRDRKHAG